jgi:hypothetical protein
MAEAMLPAVAAQPENADVGIQVERTRWTEREAELGGYGDHARVLHGVVIRPFRFQRENNRLDVAVSPLRQRRNSGHAAVATAPLRDDPQHLGDAPIAYKMAATGDKRRERELGLEDGSVQVSEVHGNERIRAVPANQAVFRMGWENGEIPMCATPQTGDALTHRWTLRGRRGQH